MAFTFPADKSDFAAPNGVTYSWDVVDGKWRVKAFMSVDDFIVQLEVKSRQMTPKTATSGSIHRRMSSLYFVYTGVRKPIPLPRHLRLDGNQRSKNPPSVVQPDLSRVESGLDNRVNRPAEGVVSRSSIQDPDG